MTINAKNIKIDQYTYHLPEEKIAKYPLANRSASKLLVYRNGSVNHDRFYHITDYLPQNSLLVFNNTKVIQARIILHKRTGAKIEIFCLEPIAPPDFSLAFSRRNRCRWKCIVGNLKKWKTESLSRTFTFEDKTHTFTASKTGEQNDAQVIEFSWDGDMSFGEVLENIGITPIPPYLNRRAIEKDRQTYQTVYAKHNGSVAAPTAGLHFTPEVLKTLGQKNIVCDEITLHVGAGTFKPVKSETIGRHDMHTEHFFVSLQTIENLIKYFPDIVSVGTTTLRTLESLYWLGIQIIHKKEQDNTFGFKIGQWEPYQNETHTTPQQALEAIKNYMQQNGREILNVITQIIIVPGYTFRIVKGLITNFHQPRSTLLLLVAAFTGSDWRKIYDYALHNDFRFLSYGDSSILI